MNGGYIMIYKNSRKIYLELFACLTMGKPILWYEDKNTCFFIDTISGGEISTEIVDDEEIRTYGDIILTKGGMTITITAENVVTEVGDIQPSEGSLVVANPTLSGDENDLTGLEVDGVKYAVSSGSEVTANPTLSGDEDALSGLEVDGVKYAVSSGGSALYMHRIRISASSKLFYTSIVIINNSNVALNTYALLTAYIYNNFGSGLNGSIIASGGLFENSVYYNNVYIYASSASSLKCTNQNIQTGDAHEFSIPSSSGITLINDYVTQIN